MPTAKIVFLYVTAPNIKVAERLSKILIKKKLIACANIFPKMKSIYWWKNKITKESEVVMILKTSSTKMKEARVEVEAQHPYQVPCIAEIWPGSVNTTYKNWLMENLKTNRRKKHHANAQNK